MRVDQQSRALPVASPANMLPVQVVGREEIAPDTVSVLLVLPGTRQAPAPYLPGQFVTLALPTQRETLYRSYSLCGDGSPDQPWELTIKRMERGAVSTYFYEEVDVGTLLYASLPRGTFTLPTNVGPEMTLIMIAMGSGITPIMGMLRALANMPLGQPASDAVALRLALAGGDHLRRRVIRHGSRPVLAAAAPLPLLGRQPHECGRDSLSRWRARREGALVRLRRGLAQARPAQATDQDEGSGRADTQRDLRHTVRSRRARPRLSHHAPRGNGAARLAAHHRDGRRARRAAQ